MYAQFGPGTWQSFVKRADNIGLPLEVVTRKYIMEAHVAAQMMATPATTSAGGGGGNTASVGGSGTITFNGTNAYVRVPNNTLKTWMPGTGDFTVEWFFKKTGSGTGFPRVFSIGPDTTATLGCSIEGGTPTCYIWADNGDSSGMWVSASMPAAYNAGNWIHMAVVRISGVVRLYINGQYKTKDSSVRLIDDTINAGEPMYMGGDGVSNWWQGNLTNFRFTNSGVYTGETTITIPTSPLTALSQTKLLLLGGSVTNPVVDATGINTLINSNTGWSADTPF